MVLGAIGAVSDGFDLFSNVTEATEDEPSIALTYATEYPSDTTTNRSPDSIEDSSNPVDVSEPSTPTASPTGDCAQDLGTPDDPGREIEPASGPAPSAETTMLTGDSAVHPDEIDEDPDELTVDEVLRQGGYRVGAVDLEIGIENPTEQRMTISTIELEIGRQDVPDGTLRTNDRYDFERDFAPTDAVFFDLEDDHPVATASDEACGDSGSVFESQDLIIDPGSTEFITLHLKPGDCLCDVRAEITYWLGLDQATMLVPDQSGDPVPVVGVAQGGYGIVYVEDDQSGDVEKHGCFQKTHEYCRPKARLPSSRSESPRKNERAHVGPLGLPEVPWRAVEVPSLE